ncbi:prolyl oligopeptidase family-domain-containing protein [Ochromonadaceae sp. CCMP2298]|nr:prolyl oligopeptidase family-domain-containing protein [Ochromonadaceae sp. CCMP2298]
MPMDGTTPTLLYGYGGFEISLPPVYSGVVGAGWLDTTGEPPSDTGTASASTPYRAYVMANIRGGGEFGPAWHQAALRENRKLAYDDFIAVAEDLIARGVTSSAKLGIRGGSNGGLLMGNMITRRPDLFGAVCCAVPLLDMKCYHTLLAGASWVAEYGNPDSQDWDFLKSYSAYHNISPTWNSNDSGNSEKGNSKNVGGGNYPSLLMTTSTRDDRVHPYHARSFVKRMLECGGEGEGGAGALEEGTVGEEDVSVSGQLSDKVSFTLGASKGGNATLNVKLPESEAQSPSASKYITDKVFYYENIEGGHGGAADSKQQAFMSVLYLEFLKRVLK